MDNLKTSVLYITPATDDRPDARRTEALLAHVRPSIDVSCINQVKLAPITSGADAGNAIVAVTAPDIILLDHTMAAEAPHLHLLSPKSPIIIIGGADDTVDPNPTTDAAAQSPSAAQSPFKDDIVFDRLDAAHIDLSSLSRIIRHAVEHKAHIEITHQYHELQLVHTMSYVINGNLDLRLKLGMVLEQVIYLLGIDAADILILNSRSKQFYYSVGRGFKTPDLLFNSAPLTQSYASRAASEKRLVTLNHLDTYANGSSTEVRMVHNEGFVTYLGMPLIAKGQLYGVLGMFKRTDFAPDTVWTGFAETFARQAASAIANALFENSMSSKLDTSPYYEGGVEDWSHAIDRAAKETPGHSRRVADFTVRLGRTIGMSEANLLHMYQGALLHDVGKMGIPDDVLMKPGPLTAEEWSLMRRHPLYAYHMLASIDYLQTSIDIPYLHHEHWDGSGYPLGLSGEEIPLMARVFAIADAWDALCSDKPFRKAWSQRQAYELIYQDSGSYFDPDLVVAFQKLISAKAS